MTGIWKLTKGISKSITPVDAVTAILVTYLYMQRLKDSARASVGKLELFNQSFHLFNLQLHLLHVSVILGM